MFFSREETILLAAIKFKIANLCLSNFKEEKYSQN